MEPDILKAIPRQKVIKQYVLLMLLGGAGVFLAQSQLFPWIKEYLSVNDATEALRRLKLVMLGFGASILPVSAYLALLARRIIKSGQLPPPGTQVWRDTPIIRGRKALWRGWIIAVCALLMVALAGYAAYFPYGLFKTLHRNTPLTAQ